jgi:hypothetical protein
MAKSDHDGMTRDGVVSVTAFVTLVLVWTWVWTLNPDPAFHDVGVIEWVPPHNEPTNSHGATTFWSGDYGEDILLFHGLLATPPELPR